MTETSQGLAVCNAWLKLTTLEPSHRGHKCLKSLISSRNYPGIYGAALPVSSVISPNFFAVTVDWFMYIYAGWISACTLCSIVHSSVLIAVNFAGGCRLLGVPLV